MHTITNVIYLPATFQRACVQGQVLPLQPELEEVHWKGLDPSAISEESLSEAKDFSGEESWFSVPEIHEDASLRQIYQCHVKIKIISLKLCFYKTADESDNGENIVLQRENTGMAKKHASAKVIANSQTSQIIVLDLTTRNKCYCLFLSKPTFQIFGIIAGTFFCCTL